MKVLEPIEPPQTSPKGPIDDAMVRFVMAQNKELTHSQAVEALANTPADKLEGLRKTMGLQPAGTKSPVASESQSRRQKRAEELLGPFGNLDPGSRKRAIDLVQNKAADLGEAYRVLEALQVPREIKSNLWQEWRRPDPEDVPPPPLPSPPQIPEMQIPGLGKTALEGLKPTPTTTKPLRTRATDYGIPPPPVPPATQKSVLGQVPAAPAPKGLPSQLARPPEFGYITPGAPKPTQQEMQQREVGAEKGMARAQRIAPTAEQMATGELKSKMGAANKAFYDTFGQMLKSAGVLVSEASRTPGGVIMTPEGIPFDLGQAQPPTVKPEETPMWKVGQSLVDATERLFPQNPKFATDFSTTLAQGAGSMAAFVVSGVAGKAVRLPEFLVTIATGAGAQGAQGYEEAKAAGVSDDKIRKSFVLNMGLGATEAIPVERSLARIDAVTGGLFSRWVKNKVAAGALQGSLEEFIQEFGQNLGSNIVAQQIYEPERPAMGGVLPQATAGGILGLAMSGLTSALGLHIAKTQGPEQQRKAKEQWIRDNSNLAEAIADWQKRTGTTEVVGHKTEAPPPVTAPPQQQMVFPEEEAPPVLPPVPPPPPLPPVPPEIQATVEPGAPPQATIVKGGEVVTELPVTDPSIEAIPKPPPVAPGKKGTIQAVFEDGEMRYRGLTPDGKDLGVFPTVQEAREAAERYGPVEPIVQPPTEQLAAPPSATPTEGEVGPTQESAIREPAAEPPVAAGPTAAPPELPKPPVAPIAKPKKTFQFQNPAGKQVPVVGMYKGQVVLEDGSLIDKKPSVFKTLKAYGYQELSDEQMAGIQTAPTPTAEEGVPPIVETPAKAEGEAPPVVETAPPPEKEGAVAPQGAAEFLVDGTKPVTVETSDYEVTITLSSNNATAGFDTAQKALVQAGLNPDEYEYSHTVTTGAFIPGQGAEPRPKREYYFKKKAKAAEAATPPVPAPPAATAAASAGKFRVEVIADNSGKWSGNAKTYATREEAEAAAQDLASRWIAVRDWRVVEDEAAAAPEPVPAPTEEKKTWDYHPMNYTDEKGNSKEVDGEIYGTQVVYKSPIGRHKGEWVVARPTGMITDGPFPSKQAAKKFVETGERPAVPPTVPAPAPAPELPAPPAEKPKFGSQNTTFTEDKAAAARERIRKKLSGQQLSAGIDPELMSDMFTLGGYYFEGGLREFAAWSKQIISDVGEGVRPYLRGAFQMIQDHFEQEVQPAVPAPGEMPTPPAVEGGPRAETGERAGEDQGGGAPGGGIPEDLAAGTGGEAGVGPTDERPDGGVHGGKPAQPGAAGTDESKHGVERAARERFTLVGRDPINLTPGERREINRKAKEIAESKNIGDPLTPEEQEILRKYTGFGGLDEADVGVLFQHYTSYKVVQWQWDKIKAMGYPLEGASILEPAAGVGNYLGFAPTGTKLTAVEIDPVAAKIAALLYPHATVKSMAFENYNPREKFDIIISNVPFHESRGALRYSGDAEKYKDIDTLHDFFFVKALDLLKPNGMIVFLTSTGTMDKQDPTIRRKINEKAEFLGAYRTPGGEFKKNTQYGGSVDAIFLRKRTGEEILQAIKDMAVVIPGQTVEQNVEWMFQPEFINAVKTDKYSKPTQQPANLSTYYVNNPQQAWGQLEAGFGVRFETQMGVRPTQPIDDFMKKSITDPIVWIPRETVMKFGLEETEKQTPVGKAPEGAKNGQMVIFKKDKKEIITYVADEHLYAAFPHDLPPKTQSRVLAGVRMMDLVGKLYDALRVNDIATANKIRPKLKNELTEYQTKYGKPPGYDPYLWRFIAGGAGETTHPFADPRIWQLAGVTDDKGRLSAIFEKNTIWKPEIPPRVYDSKNLVDVANWVYEDTGEFDLARIAEVYTGEDLDRTEVGNSLVGEPGFSVVAISAYGTVQVDIDAEYYYGSIWPKIDQTQAMLQMVKADPGKFRSGLAAILQKQLAQLTEALPTQATVENMPVDIFASYMDHGTVLRWLEANRLRGELVHVPENNRWMWNVYGNGEITVEVPLPKDVRRSLERQGRDVPADATLELKLDREKVQDFLNHKRVKKDVPTGETDFMGRPKFKEVFDVEAQTALDKLGDDFKDWFKANTNLVEHLAPVYNRHYRSFRHREFAGRETNVQDLSATFKGKPLEVKQHQWQVNEQLLHTRSGINAHGVGGGKTMSGILMAQVARQRGLIRKPMFVVPAKVIKNWAYEITQLFPTAIVLDTSNMNSKNRNKLLNRVAASDADFVLVTYDAMKEIPLRASEEYIQEDLRDFEARLRALKEKGGDKKNEKYIQKKILKYQEKLARIQAMKKTNAIFFEDLGVDSIIIDEAHNYKNAPVEYFDMSEWLHAAGFADRAADMGYKTRYIHERKGGRRGQNVFGLTATPTPNNPIEIYSMLKYFAPAEWTDRNILNGGDFVEQFGIVGAIEEPSTTGVPKVRTVFMGYKNLIDLRAIFKRYVDMRPTSAFAIKRPTAQFVEHVMEPTKEVIFEAARVAELDHWVSKNAREAMMQGWIPLSVLTLARKLAADLAVYDPIKYGNSLGREGSKLHEIMRQIKQADNGENTQLVFVDLYRATTKVEVGSEQEKLVQMWLAETPPTDPDELAQWKQSLEIEDEASELVQGEEEKTDEEKAAEAEEAEQAAQAEAHGVAPPKVKMKTYELINIHKAIRKALIEAGVPADQIAIINQGSNNSAKAKFKLQQDNREGKVRFLIGTTQSMGEGMNLDANTTDIHHYDVPWTPAALEQREGRGVRQGNKNELVRVHRYVGKGTSDAKMYAILHRKAQWNHDLWFGDADVVMDFDQDRKNYADISSEAKIDQSTLEYWQTARRITVNTEKLAELETEDLKEARRMQKKIAEDIEHRRNQIKKYEADIQAGRGSQHTFKLIDDHANAIAQLEQDLLQRNEVVKKAEDAIKALQAALETDKKSLIALIADAKAKGMPVLPEHEALAAEEPKAGIPKPVEGPPTARQAMGLQSPPEPNIGLDWTAMGFRPPPPVQGPPAATKPATPQVATPPAGATGYVLPSIAGKPHAPPLPPKLEPPITIGNRTYASTPVNIAVPKGDPPKVVSGWHVAPGLVIHRTMDGQRYSITHETSGYQLSTAGTPELAISKAERLATVGDWSRSLDDLKADTVFMQAAQKKLNEEGVFGFFRRSPQPKIQQNLTDAPNPQMRVFINRGHTVNPWQDIREFPSKVYRFMQPAIYNADIKMWPIFAERTRRAQEMASDAANKTRKQIEGVVKGLDTSEYKVFRSIIYWEDMYETGVTIGAHAIPLQTPNALNEIDTEITRLRSVATPEVLQAVDRHHQWMDEVFNDLVSRGKALASQGKVKYFPNIILRFGDSMPHLPGLPLRMKDPRRMYLKQRKGHEQKHESDYIGVMEQYGTKVNLHNMIDDFINATADEYDLLRTAANRNPELPTLSSQQIQAMLNTTHGAVKPGAIYTLPDGRKAKGFQFTQGRVLYPVQAINDYVIQDALDAGLDELMVDLDDYRQKVTGGLPIPPTVDVRQPLMTDLGEELTRGAMALGGRYKTYLLPIEVANKLERFRQEHVENPVTEAIRVGTKVFKMAVLHANVAAWQGQNILSNELGLWLENMDALARQPEALQLLRGKLTGPQYDTLIDMINDARIWNSSFIGTGGGVGRAINAPELRKYRESTGIMSKLNPFGDNPIGDFMRSYERKLKIIEAVPKVASFLENYDRVQRGLQVKTTGVGLAGLDPTSELAIGRAARNQNLDYGTTSVPMQFINGVLFPFMPFYSKILPQVARAITKKSKLFPGDEFLVKMLSLYLAAYLWNHFVYPDVEDGLDWQKEMLHVNTPFTDKDGKPVVWAMQTPVDVAAEWTGLHTLDRNLDDVNKGKMTLEEGAKKQLQDIFGFQERATVATAPGALLERLANPMFDIYADLRANRDRFTGQEIVSKANPNLWGDTNQATPQAEMGKQIQREYIAKKLFAPYMQFLRASQMTDADMPIWNWVTETGPFAWRKFFGIRTSNPEAVARNEWYADRNWQQSLHDVKMLEIRDLRLALARDDIKQADYDARFTVIDQKPGITPNPAEIARMEASPAYQVQLIDDQLRTVTDPQKRKELQDARKFYKQIIDLENMKETPRVLRPTMAFPPTMIPELPRVP